jgi:hypothetical protein
MMGWEYFNNAEARRSRIDCDSFQRGVEFFSGFGVAAES